MPAPITVLRWYDFLFDEQNIKSGPGLNMN